MDKSETANEIADKNAKEAIDLAKNIYKIVTDPRFYENFDADTRHKTVVQKYPNFANAYPVILRLMARDMRYNERAFKRFLDKLKTNPGKGMNGFIERQADYVKFLYIEECRSTGKHYDNRKANMIWNIEYNNMNKNVKKIEAEEKAAKNEFAEEQQKHLDLKRKELLDFLNTVEPQDEPMENKSENKSDDADTISEIIQTIRQLKDYRLSLIEELQEISADYNKNEIQELPEFDLEKSLSEENIKTLLDYIKDIKQNIINIENILRNKKEILENEIKIKNEQSNISGKNTPKTNELDENDLEWLEGIVTINKKPSTRKNKNRKK